MKRARAFEQLLDKVYPKEKHDAIEEKRQKLYAEQDEIRAAGDRVLTDSLSTYVDASREAMALLESKEPIPDDRISRIFNLSFPIDGSPIELFNYDVIVNIVQRIPFPTREMLVAYMIILPWDTSSDEVLRKHYPYVLILELHVRLRMNNATGFQDAVAVPYSSEDMDITVHSHFRGTMFKGEIRMKGLYVQLFNYLQPCLALRHYPYPAYEQTGPRRIVSDDEHSFLKKVEGLPRMFMCPAAMMKEIACIPKNIIPTAHLVLAKVLIFHETKLPRDVIPVIFSFVIGDFTISAIRSILTAEQARWCLGEVDGL